MAEKKASVVMSVGNASRDLRLVPEGITFGFGDIFINCREFKLRIFKDRGSLKHMLFDFIII